MQLSFYAKPGHCVHWPGLKATGQAVDYVGRDLVRGDKDKGFAAAHPASKEPVKVDAASDEARRFIKVCRRDAALWPADKATAEACGVAFVEVALSADDGEWHPKPAAFAKKDSK